MAFCTDCGQVFQVGTKYCGSCGGVAKLHPAAGKPSKPAVDYTGTAPSPLPLVYLFTKSGGWLALKGFVLAVVLAVAGEAPGLLHAPPMVLFASFGVGILYLIANFLKWRRETVLVLGIGVGWMMAVLLAVSFATSAIGPSATASRTAALANEAVAAAAVESEPPREILLREVQLGSKWRHEWYGALLIADFTVDNPTPYRFKDLVIRCTHYAPSGTEVGSNTQTIYQVVDPASKRRFPAVNMGFNRSQGATSACVLRDVTVMP